MSANILIIEDDVNTVDIVSATLAPLGVNILHLRTGQEAIQLLQEEPPHLILVDVRLPASSMSGDKFVENIKSNNQYAHIPVIVVTASGAEGVMKVMKAGADDYLEKPFAIGVLRRMVSRYLGVGT